MSSNKAASLILSALKFNGIILAIDLLIATVFMLIAGNSEELDPISVIDNLLFLEAGLALLAGGATEAASTASFSKLRETVFRTKENWTNEKYRKGRQRALLYILIGTLLAVESILLALVISP